MSYAGNNRLPFRYLIPEPPAAPMPADSPKLKYPIKDREGDFVTDKQTNPFYLKDPPAIKEDVEYDPKTGMYIVTEKLGDQNLKPPTYMSYDDYLKYTSKQEEKAYWNERATAVNLVEEKGLAVPIQIKKQFFDRLFGGSKIEIKPQGNVEMTLGANIQKTGNPNIPIRNRKTGGFDFDMNININVIGKIGDKLQLGVKYNTQSGFAFDNQVKIGYTGEQDDIIRSIEAGNVSLPLPTRLISGSQTLFGLKTQFQFGRLTWTSVVSQQQSKKETMIIENGAQRQNFEIHSDQYEENKHFLLAQFFYNQYDDALSRLPNIRSVVNVTRIEVWVTNRTAVTQNVRDVVGFMDLGEAQPFSNEIISTAGGDGRPRNGANNLYGKLTSSPNYRFVDNIVSTLQGPNFMLQQGQDFEKTYARKLNTNEYTFNPQLGYISLNSQLNPNDILAVAYQYEYNGKVFQVGEFGDQVPPDSNSTSKVLYLKLLKGTSPRTNLPVWNLMMKNIYSLGAFNVSKDDFYLDIYYNDPGGGLKRYMPAGCIEGVPLLRDENLDNLNTNNDPQPDGLFDFIPGVTILPQTGRLIFPVLKPFGQHLKDKFCPQDAPIVNTYIYSQLYDSTKFIAQQYPEFNRFVIKGQYKGSNGSQISLGAGNIPRGSVVVTAGGQKLTEGTDYTMDYNLGRLTIINQSILNSGQQIKVDYENNNQFASQTRTMFGTRLDYKISNKFNIGATVMQLSERPFTQKVNIGDDPIKNTIMGADIKYETNAPWLTKALDALPIYSTKEMSTISTYGEVAYLKPGHNKAINDPKHQGQVYIDDFEGTSTGYDLKTPVTSWHLASTPRGAPGQNGQPLFPEASLVNDEAYGYNRAKISWYRIDNSFFNSQTSPNIVYINNNSNQDHYARLVPYQEVFPNSPVTTLDQNLYTFDIGYYPSERGPYNYEFSSQRTRRGSQFISQGINQDGSLKNPETRWGGLMRAIDNTDLEATNVEYIEFWLLDPFLNPTMQNSSGGKLYINLGSISEDILRDSRMAFENGLTTDQSQLDETSWGEVPKLPPLVNAFDNDPNLRVVQDVGLDGLSDADERTRKAQFLTNVAQNVNGAALAKLQNDPSSDDYIYFQDENVYGNEPSIEARYKSFSGVEGNSPVQTNSVATTAQTNLPDKEDLNNDNTLNEDEEFFQYEVDLRPRMNVGSNPYIVTVEDANNDANIVKDKNGTPSRWIQFRVPIRQYTSRVGNISDFKSIQFMRMFLTGWQDAVVMRFGTLQLTRNQWRTYTLSLDDACDGVSPHGGQTPFFNVGSVGIENNAAKTPVNYTLPPDIERQQALGQQTNQYVAQDEQSLAISMCDLQDCQRKAVFKNLSLDLRNYKRLQMFVHANKIVGETPVHDKEVTAFIRIGSDFVDNYYEYEIPLKITPDGVYSNDDANARREVWPDSNQLDIGLQDFVSLKEKRNLVPNFPHTSAYTTTDSKGNLMTIKGNPDIGAVKTVMLGVHNPWKGDPLNPLPKGEDDGTAKCVEVWFDELRANGLDESGGVAALGTIAVKLADLGNVSLGGSMHTAGFGQIEQKLDQRYKDNLYRYDFASNVDAGKLLPKDAGIRIPFYGNYSQAFSTPKYDPYQFDITSKQMVKDIKSAYGGDSSRRYLRTIQTINTNRGFNFTNVRIVPKTKAKRPHIYDPGNFNFTYSYNEILLSDPYTEKNSKKTWLGLIGWTFAPQSKDYAPFKKIIKSKSKWLDIVKDFSFNPYPSTMAVTSQWQRILNTLQLRSLGEIDFVIPPSYSKTFTWNRTYNFKYNPFKSLSIDYTAFDNARIDEPIGLLDTKAKRDEVWHNVGQGGRNTNYNQTLAVNYSVPINKLPIFDWVTATVGYASTYNWTALPWQLSSNPVDSAAGKLVQNTLGNIISNTQNDRAKLDFNLKKIYDRVPFLKTYDSPNPNLGDKKENDKKREAVKKARAKIKDEIAKLKETRDKLKIDLKTAQLDAKTDTSGKKLGDVKRLKAELKANRKAIKQKKLDLHSKQFPSDPFISIGLRPLLAIKKVTLEYKENKGTTLPGFEGYSRLLGVDYKTHSPNYGFAFGAQPGDRFWNGVDKFSRDEFLDNAAAKGWITKDTLLNQPFTQNRSQRLDFTGTVEPFPDFKIDLTFFRDNTFNHTEFFKYVADANGNYTYAHLNPMDMGSYSISYLPIKTFFAKITKEGYSATYTRFEQDRAIISQRLGYLNPNVRRDSSYRNPSTGETNPAYAEGYGPLSQDVLIPAFLAAYTKSDPHKVNLNPFKAKPLPNWRISYNGFSKFKWIQKVFTNLTISHGYNSTLTINNFQSNLSYLGDGTLFAPRAKDSLSGNYTSLYNMPSVVLNEQFSPLIGVDMTFKNNVTAKFDYKKSRTMTVNFADFQMIELNSQQFTVGAGYKIKGLKLPIKIKGRKIRLDNDLNFRFDFSYRENVTINHRIDQGVPEITQGTKTFSIQPSIDYVVSKRLNVRLFYDQTSTYPKISNSYPTTNIKAGITFRFSLAE